MASGLPQPRPIILQISWEERRVAQSEVHALALIATPLVLDGAPWREGASLSTPAPTESCVQKGRAKAKAKVKAKVKAARRTALWEVGCC